MDDDDTGTDEQAKRHHVIPGSSLVEVFGKRPRSCVSIVRLNGRTTPGRVAVAVNEEFAIATHNGNHDGIIYETAQDSAIDLGKEHGPGRNLDCNDGSASVSTDGTEQEHIRYSPIFRSLHKLTVFAMTLCDQAAKYMLPMGRPGRIRPAISFDRLFVAMPLP